MCEIDWDAPLDAGGRERSMALRAALGINTPYLDKFLDDLDSELSADAWGFERLTDITNEEQRGLVSDQLLSAGHGLRDALVDTSISLSEVIDCTGPNGLRYAGRHDSLNDILRYERLRRAVASFFDAMGTSLDCLAAILIVVVRAPLSVQRADFGALRKLNADANHSKAFKGQISDEQRKHWRSLLLELENGLDAGPDGWLEWSLEMRNALTHRGRVTNVYMPRPISGRIVVPPTAQPHALYRYDLHLRKRPWLPEIEGMLVADGLQESWLDEPASQTTSGLRHAIVKYAETLIAWASDQWQSPPDGLIAPLDRWILPAPSAIEFSGIDPGGTTPIQGGIGGINEEHMHLAERLRISRLEQANENDP